MASLLDKIKHKINPKTADIEDENAKKIGTTIKEIQVLSESLAKKARKIKQKIKSDVEIKPDDAKRIAKDLIQDSNNSYLSLLKKNLKGIKVLCENLNLEQAAEKLETATEKVEKAQITAKSEKPEVKQPVAVGKSSNITPSSKKTDTPNRPSSPSFSYTNANDTVSAATNEIEISVLNFIKEKKKNQNELNAFVKKLNDWLEESDISVKLPELTNANVKEYFKKLSDPLKNALDAVERKKNVPFKAAVNLLNNVSKGFNWLNNLTAIVGPTQNSLGMLKALGFAKSFDHKYVYFKDDKLDADFRGHLSNEDFDLFGENAELNGKYDITDKKQNPTAWYYSNNDNDKKVKEFLAKNATNYIIFK